MGETTEQKLPRGQARIHIPVALPAVFLGAPIIPAGLWASICLSGMMFFFIKQSLIVYALVMIGVFFPGHGFLMWYGRREPHLSSLLQVYTKGGTKMRARSIGRGRRRPRVFFPG